MRFYPHLLSFLLLLSLTQAQNLSKESTLYIGPNFRIYPSNVSQTEVFAVTHPSKPDTMFVSCNTIIFSTAFVSEGCYATTNGGVSWYGSDTCKGAPINLHGGDPGITISKDGTFILTRRGFSPGLYSHYSTDAGVTWSNQKNITTDDLERGTLTSDVHSQSPFYGRSYAAWAKLSGLSRMNFSYSDDNGISWSAPAQINNPSLRSAGGDITMGPGGKVYLCWAGVTSVSPFTEVIVGIASSTTGGATWQVKENAFNINGINGVLSQKGNIRVNGLPNIAVDTTGGPRHGWIYIITTQRNLSPAGSDPDIILNRSTDGGVTWSPGIRVNQDPVNNGKIQYFPAVHVDKTGGLNVIFYDDRNTTSDSTGVFLARSEDGGNNWREFEISDKNFKPVPIGGLGQGYQGDNISITSSRNKLFPFWMDNRTGNYQIWTVPINISLVNVEPSPEIVSSYNLEQNYPNPFNPGTKIRFRIANSEFVSLKVFDLLGNEVAVLLSEEKPAGSYEVEFSANDLSSGIFAKGGYASGIYFYQLRAGSFKDTKKMILLR